MGWIFTVWIATFTWGWRRECIHFLHERVPLAHVNIFKGATQEFSSIAHVSQHYNLTQAHSRSTRLQEVEDCCRRETTETMKPDTLQLPGHPDDLLWRRFIGKSHLHERRSQVHYSRSINATMNITPLSTAKTRPRGITCDFSLNTGKTSSSTATKTLVLLFGDSWFPTHMQLLRRLRDDYQFMIQITLTVWVYHDIDLGCVYFHICRMADYYRSAPWL